jgi:surfeit locus 1 family protein
MRAMDMTPVPPPVPARRSRAALFAAIGLLGVALLVGLGMWQLHRRTWKLARIAQVEARLSAAPVAAPGPAVWQRLGPSDEYRRLRVRGTFRNDRETRVLALTELGSGYWVLTPLATDAGWTVLVNRGFVPAERADPAARGAGQVTGPVTVAGLLRPSEPHGFFLRANDPAHDQWYARDVPAIAARRGLSGPVAPYFIDADARPNPGGLPVGGLTVTALPNDHLSYALTWFALAAMTAAATAWLVRAERRR